MQPQSQILLLKWNFVCPEQMVSGKNLKGMIFHNVSAQTRWTSEAGMIIIIFCMVQSLPSSQVVFEKGQNVNEISSSRQHSLGVAFLACCPTLNTTILSIIINGGSGQRLTRPSVTLISSSSILYRRLLLVVNIPPPPYPSIPLVECNKSIMKERIIISVSSV